MNGYERINAVVNGKKPDKIPVMLHNFLLAAEEAGYSQENYREDPEKIKNSYIKAIEKYEYDGVLIDLDTVTLAGAAGAGVDLPENEPGRLREPLLGDIQEIDSLKPIKIENYKYVNIWLEGVRKVKEYFGNEIYVRGNCDQAPFSLASLLLGPQDFLIELMDPDNNERLYRLLDHCQDISCQFIDLMSQTGADMVSNGDSMAGPEIVSPGIYEEYALQYEKACAAQAHKAGIPYTLHICGNTNNILNLLPKTGADFVELDYKTDANRIAESLNDRTGLIGNIDPSGILTYGTVKDVEVNVRELLNNMRDFPKFILNAGCAIPATAPPENIYAMIRTARNYLS